MNNRLPHEDQSAKTVLLILGFLFCLAVVFVSVVGFVGLQIYSARRAALVVADEQAMLAAKAQAEAREEQYRANELIRQAEEAKHREIETLQQLQNQKADEERRLTQQEREEEQREQAERELAENRRRQLESDEARKKQNELGLLQRQLAEFESGFRAWHSNSAEKLLLPNSDGRGQGLSWRVHLLPYLGNEGLYQQFHLNEPWDSEHNLKLASQMPNVYGTQSDKTRFRCFLPVDGESPLRVGDVSDGLSQTALIFWVAESQAVLWSKPDSLTSIKAATLADVGIKPENGLIFLRADGLPLAVQRADDELVAALSSPAGGEHLNPAAVGSGDSVDKIFVCKTSAAGKPIHEPADSELQGDMRIIARAMNQWVVAMSVPEVEKAVTESRLSWRVHLLPYLGEEELYRRFRHEEPWFSDHNSKLIERMPAVYGAGASGGRCRVHAYCNERVAGFPLGLRKPETQLQNQVCLFYCAPQNAETWTASTWMAASPMRMQAALGWPVGKSIVAGFADGNSAILPANLHPSKLAAFFNTDNKPKFNLELALESPTLPLRIEVAVQPASPIAGLYPLTEVPIPAEGFKQPTPLDPGTQKRLRSVGMAMHQYYDTFKTSPATSKRPNGTLSELSWRVHLLPMLDQGSLYEKFALDESWDSPTNKKLVEFMPEVFQNILGKPTETSLHVLTGEASLFGGNRNWMSAKDGLQNTVMIMELPAKQAIPWTQPEKHDVVNGLSFNELTDGNGMAVVMGDGTYARLSDISDDLFFGLATGSGGELMDAQTIARWSAAKRGEYLIAQLTRKQWQQNQLKQIALAILNYESTFRMLPPARRDTSNGIIAPESYQLSWRVHVLPFLGYANLYNQFRLAEPWDSPHNSQLLKCMPDCFRDATASPTSSETRIMSFSGQGTLFPAVGDATKLSQITDGISATIAFFQAPPNQTVPWTKPEDYELDATSVTTATPALSKLRNALGIEVALIDGSVLTIPPDYPLEKIQAMITPRGGEVVNASELRN